MQKNIQKCLRLSEATFYLVDSVEGNGFNQKFENLVMDYYNTIPERERRKAELDELISKMREDIKKLYESINRAGAIEAAIDRVLESLEI